MNDACANSVSHAYAGQEVRWFGGADWSLFYWWPFSLLLIIMESFNTLTIHLTKKLPEIINKH